MERINKAVVTVAPEMLSCFKSLFATFSDEAKHKPTKILAIIAGLNTFLPNPPKKFLTTTVANTLPTIIT